MLVDHDVHVHTALSACCNDPEATAANLIARAAEVGLRTIGFADHLWDSAVAGASDWYRPQDVPHVLAIRREIPADTRGVRVLIGCETEYCGGGKVALSPEAASQFDFVLVPTSHFHMKGFVVPDEALPAPRLAPLLLDRFREALGLNLGVPMGIAHPFVPLGHFECLDKAISLLSDAQFQDAFGRAAERRISMEVHPAMFPSLGRGEKRHFHDETFLRVLTIARQAGCLFHFASDAHRLDAIGSVRRLEPFATAIGITPQHIHPLFRADPAA
ncbi:MAG TPA: PHP domain-containing protein [Phycisphaerae bacterium]|nr:PHP domain-containing protein [Phycisphaerae bacterium]